MKKRMMSLFLCLSVAVSFLLIPAQASPAPKYTAEAEALYQLGLFRGTGTNPDGTPIFALERSATRMQGLIMLIRLMGEEEAALSYTGACPFRDVSGNSAKYAAYAKNKGYTAGTTATAFGNGNLKSNAFLTFVLRALGYSDQAGDFSYSSACSKAEEIGLIDANMYRSGQFLLRDDCVIICYRALNQRMKDSELMLAEKLLLDGVIYDDAVNTSDVLNAHYLYVDYDVMTNTLYRLPADASRTELESFTKGLLARAINTPVQYTNELEAANTLLDNLPDSTYACANLKPFKAELQKIRAMGGARAYVDDSNDINPNTFESSNIVYGLHSNAEARAFVANYVRNFDPAFLFADQFPDKPANWNHGWEFWYGADYVKNPEDIQVGREYWEENLNVLRFAAITNKTPDNLSSFVRTWQTGEMSDVALKNYFDYWMALGGVHMRYYTYVE